MGSDLDAVSNSFFECVPECSLGVTVRLAVFDVSSFLKLRSKLSSSFLEFWGVEASFLLFVSSSEALNQGFFEFRTKLS